MSKKTLYVLYNAESTLLGKLRYGYRKLSNRSEKEAACAACDITHGGLSLSESPGWLKAKAEIEGEGIKIVQWHKDEIDNSLRDYLQLHGVKYPAVILSEEPGSYTTLMTSSDLNACAGDPEAMIEELRQKDLLARPKVTSSL